MHVRAIHFGGPFGSIYLTAQTLWQSADALFFTKEEETMNKKNGDCVPEQEQEA